MRSSGRMLGIGSDPTYRKICENHRYPIARYDNAAPSACSFVNLDLNNRRPLKPAGYDNL